LRDLALEEKEFEKVAISLKIIRRLVTATGRFGLRQAENTINNGERQTILFCDLKPGEWLYTGSKFLETHHVTDLLSL